MTVEDWFAEQGYTPAPFQKQIWQHYQKGNNGLLIAPTGSGKTYAMLGGVIKAVQSKASHSEGVKLLWITPLRALTVDIAQALRRMCDGIGLDWQIEIRTGDTSSSIKARQRKKLPDVLVTTPESLHMMFSYAGSTALFAGTQSIVVDEWHDLLGTKRGVMMQLALAHLRELSSELQVWGMSATVGNPEQAMQTLLAAQHRPNKLVHDKRAKEIDIQTVIPQQIERFPWSGHMGDVLLSDVLKIITASKSTLVFTNTRNQAEVWYRKLLAADKNLAGRIALHHGSLSNDQRSWVEAALHEGKLQAVLCTSSLDLGVDFRPVDTVIQIGGPKGVARFLQRAGRSGHAPGEVSRIYFVPTNTLELFEAAALKKAVREQAVENIYSPTLSLDVLTQWLVTIGVGDGFESDMLFKQIKNTAAYAVLTTEIWQWALTFVTTGGSALGNYDHFQKLEVNNGRIMATKKEIMTRHRLSIGAISSSSSVPVRVLRGSVLGSVEESFAGSLQKGQTFWFSGRALEFVRLRDNTIWVRASTHRRGITPAWSGGRLPLSSQLAERLRVEVAEAKNTAASGQEQQALKPLVALQQSWSALPNNDELLIEQFASREGSHIVVYPFEGRATHEILAIIMAHRLGVDPNTFSFAFNDYGFELLAAKDISLNEAELRRLLSPINIEMEIDHAIAAGSLPRRQFRTIAAIAGLIVTGRPGKPQSSRHLQASSEMIYDVLRDYDPDNQLLQQAYREVRDQVVDMDRLKDVLSRINNSTLLLTEPPYISPLAFSLTADRLRERLSTEKLADRIQRMQQRLERYATRT